MFNRGKRVKYDDRNCSISTLMFELNMLEYPRIPQAGRSVPTDGPPWGSYQSAGSGAK